MISLFIISQCFSNHFQADAQSTDNVNDFDIWDPDAWKLHNQHGIESGEIKFCYQPWHPYTIHKNAPKIIKCTGNDILWLSYQVHLQKVHKDKLAPLNDQFAVVLSHGHECDNPSLTIHEASQADCHNFEEFNAIMGEKCVRKNVAINLFGTHHGCLIIYCTNHQSDCKLWIRSYWTKYVKVYPSAQTIRPGTQEITINGENFASDYTLIKVKCMDDHNRILACNVTWSDKDTGHQVLLHFDQPLQKKHVGKIWIRLDSDNAGWLKPMDVAVVIDDVNPWVSMTVLTTCFLIGLIPTSIFCVFWRYQQRTAKRERRHQLEAKRAWRGSQMTRTDALDYTLAGLH